MISESQHMSELAGLSCRFCEHVLKHSFVDLGTSPLCQNHVHIEQLNTPELFYPLHAFVCQKCFLVQLGEYVAPTEIFSDYHYFSSYSDTWLAHAKSYTQKMTHDLGLNDQSQVVEIASNDGYLLQFFVENEIPAYGIEPAANVAAAAKAKGIDTVVEFFGQETATALLRERGPADLLIGNNVLAHVPNLNDFVAGLSILLAPHGVVTMEFPHLLQLVKENQFDTIYHEHFSYFSFSTVENVFAKHGMMLFDVDELSTHGGSLRIYAQHLDAPKFESTQRVARLKDKEEKAGMLDSAYYQNFDKRVHVVKRELLHFLLDAQESGKLVAGYGAPGKGNTLLNYCGIKSDLIACTVDRNPMKQGTFLPGSRIPVHSPDHLNETKPDYVLILPWNLKDEIMKQLAHIREWGGQFVTAIPHLTIM